MPYPEHIELIEDLVLNDHTEFKETPLVLAIYFKSRQFPNEECVFEVLHRFGLNEVSEVKSVFQIQFGPTPNFPLPQGDRLHLFLTNPIEMSYAIAHRWPEVVDLCEAIQSGQSKEIHRSFDDPQSGKILEGLSELARSLMRDAVAV